jgi:hypothetical protein
MIDGVKIVFYSETIVHDLQRIGVKVLTDLEELTGELYYPKEATHRHLNIKISQSKRVVISGSIHKFLKDENYTDFSFANLQRAIKELSQVFNFIPSEACVHRLEFGVNVHTHFNPFDFCNHVIAFNGNSFHPFKTHSGLKIGFEASTQRYSIKVYDKGKQLTKHRNILRFEISVDKMAFLTKAGVNVVYLTDLLNIDTLNKLGTILNERFAELIISDTVNTSALTAKENELYLLCSNPKQWGKFTPKQRFVKRKQFAELIERYGVNKWQKTASLLIAEKWDKLLFQTTETGNELTDLSEDETLQNGNELTDLLEDINTETGNELTDHQNLQKEQSNRLSNGLHRSLTQLTGGKFCKTCGRDISNQSDRSVFCSESIYGKEAKKCRNIDSNPRNYLKYREGRLYGGLNLFESESLGSMLRKQ